MPSVGGPSDSMAHIRSGASREYSRVPPCIARMS